MASGVVSRRRARAREKTTARALFLDCLTLKAQWKMKAMGCLGDGGDPIVPTAGCIADGRWQARGRVAGPCVVPS